jgi:hypothetical protein
MRTESHTQMPLIGEREKSIGSFEYIPLVGQSPGPENQEDSNDDAKGASS